MSMNYVVRKKVDKSGDNGSGALLRGIKSASAGTGEQYDELAKRLAFVSSLQVGDAQSVLVQLPDIIADLSGRAGAR